MKLSLEDLARPLDSLSPRMLCILSLLECSLLSIEREDLEREHILARIETVIGDIHHIDTQIAELEAKPPPASPAAASGGTRNPKDLETLSKELSAFDAMRAYKQMKLAELRGGKVFSPDLERLLSLRTIDGEPIIAAPAKPKVPKRIRKRPPSRPRKRKHPPAEPMLRFWVDLFRTCRERGKKITIDRALELAQSVVRERTGNAGFVASKKRYYRERKRLGLTSSRKG